MKIEFLGATESVTGSKHLLITEQGKQILLDCGLYQGLGKETEGLNRELGLDATNVDAVLLSHAHIDHSGNLPLLVKQGFRGKIYCTEATFDVCSILLLDSAHIHEGDVSFINSKRKKKGLPPIKPIYSVKDAERCLKYFKPLPFNTDFQLNEEISFYFSENGHIIGSAAINITAHEKGKTTKLTYTGDIGRYTDPLLKAPAVFQQADYIICESTYGKRLHDSQTDSEAKVLQCVQKTCVDKKGKLIIPAFSLGRTQEVLYILDKLTNKGLLPKIKIFVDSPLSKKATHVVSLHPESFNEELKAYLKEDPEPFAFQNLKYVEDAEESKSLNDLHEPCIIISASGMCDAGRVKHHIANSISNPSATILLTGYCAPGTLGAALLNGDNRVHIYGDFFDVKADVESVLSLSAHADYEGMIRYLSCQDKTRVKTIFLVHGEADAKTAFREHLLEFGFTQVLIPEKGETFEIGS
ncbi:MAG: MBL fold metallo-hydrolase [bacterium]|nr:MBL fold metallo-hydrolase [bacterium]